MEPQEQDEHTHKRHKSLLPLSSCYAMKNTASCKPRLASPCTPNIARVLIVDLVISGLRPIALCYSTLNSDISHYGSS